MSSIRRCTTARLSSDSRFSSAARRSDASMSRRKPPQPHRSNADYDKPPDRKDEPRNRNSERLDSRSPEQVRADPGCQCKCNGGDGHRCAGADKRRANACNLFARKYRKPQRAAYIRFQQCRVLTNQTGRRFDDTRNWISATLGALAAMSMSASAQAQYVAPDATWHSRQNPEWRRQTGRFCHNQVGNYLSGSC
jgi:hypothetical protein